MSVLLLLLACTLAVAPLISYKVARNTMVSPVDEVSYIDYLYKIGEGHFIVSGGETISPEAHRELVCRGMARGFLVPNPSQCDAPLPAAPSARNTADIDPPTYYVITYLGARAAQALGAADNLVTAGRLVGVAWAGSALTLLVLLGRALGASPAACAVAATTALVTPGLLVHWHHVTPHATNLTVGAAVVLLALLWDRARVGAWALVVAGALPPLVKASQIVIAIVIGAFLLLGSLWQGRREYRFDKRRLVGGIVVFAALMAASAFWLLVRAHYALTDVPSHSQLNVNSFDSQFILQNIGMFLQSWSGGAAAGLTLLVVVWCYGTAVGAVANPHVAPVVRRLSLALLPVAAFSPVIFVLSNYMLLGQYAAIPARYGFTLVPTALALGAVALRTRPAIAAGWLVCLGLLVTVIKFPFV